MGFGELAAVGLDEPAAAVGLDELMWQVAKLQAMFGAEEQGPAHRQAALPSEEPEGGPQAAALGRLGSAPPSRSPSGVTGETRAQLMEVLSRLSSSGSLAARPPAGGWAVPGWRRLLLPPLGPRHRPLRRRSFGRSSR